MNGGSVEAIGQKGADAVDAFLSAVMNGGSVEAVATSGRRAPSTAHLSAVMNGGSVEAAVNTDLEGALLRASPP